MSDAPVTEMEVSEIRARSDGFVAVTMEHASAWGDGTRVEIVVTADAARRYHIGQRHGLALSPMEDA